MKCPNCDCEFRDPCESCKGRGWLVLIQSAFAPEIPRDRWAIERCDACGVMTDHEANQIEDARLELEKMCLERPIKPKA
jgi:hypothetical protein